MARRWMRSAGAVGVVGLLALAGCSSDGGGNAAASASGGTKKEPITIGVALELSVPSGGNPAVTASGKAIQAGLDTAIKAINDGGGVDGHPLRTKVYDTGNNPTTASVVMRRAIADKPTVLAGFLSSVDMSPQVPLLQQTKIPFVYAGSFFSPLDSMDNMFTVNMSADRLSAVLVQAVEQQLGGSLTGKRIAFEGLAPSLSIDDLLTRFTAAVQKAGGTVAKVVRDPATLSSWSSQAANVAGSHVDALVISHSEAGTPVIAKALGVTGFKGPIVSVAAASTDATFKAIASPTFFGLRESAGVVSGGKLYAAVQDAGASTERALAQPLFTTKGYAMGWAIAKALEGCGTPCAWDDFPAALRKVGPVSPPDDPYYAPVDFSDSSQGIVAAQLFGWDAASAAPKAVGSLLSGS